MSLHCEIGLCTVANMHCNDTEACAMKVILLNKVNQNFAIELDISYVNKYM